MQRAKCWVYLMLCGGIVQQVGVWSLYGDLAMPCRLSGVALEWMGFAGFRCCVRAHSARWDDSDATASMFYFLGLLIRAVFNGIAILVSTLLCPSTGTVLVPGTVLVQGPVGGAGKRVDWVLPSMPVPLCTNSCFLSNNTVCEDGGSQSKVAFINK
jgi:hypothetical protein